VLDYVIIGYIIGVFENRLDHSWINYASQYDYKQNHLKS